MFGGKVALVTGGGSGIGRTTCQLLARDGAKVVVADINQAVAEETLQSLPGDDHMSICMDVSSADSVEAGINAIKDRYQEPPSICVNSAGIILPSVVVNGNEEYKKLMPVNLEGTINVTKAVCRELVEAKQPGSIVNISSIALKGFAGSTIYSASKGAVKSFSKSVAKEMFYQGKYGIRCNIVVPGAIDTPMLKVSNQAIVDQLCKSLPLGRVGTPEEVGEFVVFLASDKSSYMTGACVYVDGGF